MKAGMEHKMWEMQNSEPEFTLSMIRKSSLSLFQVRTIPCNSEDPLKIRTWKDLTINENISSRRENQEKIDKCKQTWKSQILTLDTTPHHLKKKLFIYRFLL